MICIENASVNWERQQGSAVLSQKVYFKFSVISADKEFGLLYFLIFLLCWAGVQATLPIVTTFYIYHELSLDAVGSDFTLLVLPYCCSTYQLCSSRRALVMQYINRFLLVTCHLGNLKIALCLCLYLPNPSSSHVKESIGEFFLAN